MLPLIQTVCNETGIERDESRTHVLLFRYLMSGNRIKHPHSPLSLEIVALYLSLLEVQPLYLYRSQCRITHHIHVSLTVEHQRIEILLGKQIIMLPCIFFYSFQCPVAIVRQREHGALHLQSSVQRIIEYEVVKQLICLQRFQYNR